MEGGFPSRLPRFLFLRIPPPRFSGAVSLANVAQGTEHQLREQSDPTPMPKLIMVVAFDPDEHGNLQPIFGPAEQQNEECAIRTAMALSMKYPDVVAWTRQADEMGTYGNPTVLFRTPALSGDPHRRHVK
ncbi:hypothetical protein [Mesorhizobium sp. CN2-181]|uniref:hypothetical protein n=1 Tax=Mesorhizobium yinganensis TaxID=3157707 RepID=UPI0032B77FA1